MLGSVLAALRAFSVPFLWFAPGDLDPVAIAQVEVQSSIISIQAAEGPLTATPVAYHAGGEASGNAGSTAHAGAPAATATADGGIGRAFSFSDALSISCLATAIYFEARGEPPSGQLAVGKVILNRMRSGHYPDNICGVVYQNAHRYNRCQFSFACDGKPDRVTERRVWGDILERAAWLVTCTLCSLTTPPGSIWASTHYHADYVSPSWSRKLLRTGQVGAHIFYYGR